MALMAPRGNFAQTRACVDQTFKGGWLIWAWCRTLFGLLPPDLSRRRTNLGQTPLEFDDKWGGVEQFRGKFGLDYRVGTGGNS